MCLIGMELCMFGLTTTDGFLHGFLLGPSVLFFHWHATIELCALSGRTKRVSTRTKFSNSVVILRVHMTAVNPNTSTNTSNVHTDGSQMTRAFYKRSRAISQGISKNALSKSQISGFLFNNTTSLTQALSRRLTCFAESSQRSQVT